MFNNKLLALTSWQPQPLLTLASCKLLMVDNDTYSFIDTVVPRAIVTDSS